MNQLGNIIAWENGEMDIEQEFNFFVDLVNTGLVYQLQGMYGRRARDLGLI